MKRWISATCVAMLCGAAFGQTCEKSQSCEEKAAAVSLVKGESDCASARSAPKANWLSVAFHRANAAPSEGVFVKVSEKSSCDEAKSCSEGAKASVIAASQAKDGGSCCASGQGVATAIVAAAGSAQSCDKAKAGCSETGVAVIAASTTEAQTCSSKASCSETGAVIATVASDEKTCSSKASCSETGGAVIATVASDEKTCSSKASCSETGGAVIATVASDEKTCSSKASCSETGATIATVAGPANKTCPISGRPAVQTAVASYKGKEIAFCNSMCANYFDKADESKKEAVYQTVAASFQVDQKGDKKAGPCCEDGKGACCQDSGASVSTASYSDDKAINKTCPMTGKPVVETALVEYEGKTLGFCGAGCASYFQNADTEKQAKVYSTILASQPQTDLKPEAPAVKTVKSDPYTLDICPVSGGKLGSMGDPITKVVNGREVKFCCAGCPERYEADPAKFNTKIDKMMVEQQMPYYPMKTCLVAGTALEVDGKDVGKNVIINNRLARVCCDKCAAKLRANPAEYFAKLDKAVIAKQSEHYPLESCMVMESSELGGMGEPVQLVAGNRLVKFCCAKCVGKFQKDRAAYIAKLDKAWMEKYPEHFKMAQAESAGG